MKKIILSITIILIILVRLYSQYEWTDITYHYQTGTVPPPHFFSYDLYIHTNGDGQLVYTPSYTKDYNWVYKISITQGQIDSLNSLIVSSNILNEEIKAIPDNKHPIGGPLKNVRILLYQDPRSDQKPKSIITPYFPEEVYKDKLAGLYEYVSSCIPQEIWDDIKTRKEALKK